MTQRATAELDHLVVLAAALAAAYRAIGLDHVHVQSGPLQLLSRRCI